MKKDVIITISAKPKYDTDDEADNIELITSGKFYRKNGIYYIIYKESEITGLDGVTTTLKVEEDRVSLMRSGLFSSQMLFEQGQKHVGLYDTGTGSLTVSVCAKNIINKINDNGGSLSVDYSIEINNTLAGENLFLATVKEACPIES